MASLSRANLKSTRDFENVLDSFLSINSADTDTISGAFTHDGTSAQFTNGYVSHTQRITALTEALDLSSVATAMPYSGGIFTIDADSGAYALTLPTATSSGEAGTLLGWWANAVLIDVHATNDVTIVRGDTTNDTITSHGIVGIAASGASGALTITSDVITFDASDDDAVGDNVDIYCYAASDTVTAYGAKAICAS